MVFYQWSKIWRDQPWQLNISVWTSSTFRETDPHFDNYRSWIDLIFTSHPNLEIDFSKHPSLDENCHYQIIYNKFDLKIFDPPQYEGTVLHYQQADTELIKISFEIFNWKNAFSNCNPNQQVSVLTKTILNIMSNFMTNETMLVNDRDPPWITSKLKNIIQEKKLYKTK